MRIARSEVLKGKANEEEICSFAVLLPFSIVAVVASYSSQMNVAGGVKHDGILTTRYAEMMKIDWNMGTIHT